MALVCNFYFFEPMQMKSAEYVQDSQVTNCILFLNEHKEVQFNAWVKE